LQNYEVITNPRWRAAAILENRKIITSQPILMKFGSLQCRWS